VNVTMSTPSRLSRIRTAAFPNEERLDAAIDALVHEGYPEDTLGVAVRESGVCLLSVIAPAGREREVDVRLAALGADLVGGVKDLPSAYGMAPHPGVREEHDMKLPMGREFPATSWAPSIAGYRVRAPLLDAHTRVWSFDEVEPGYAVSEALMEADRCLHCPEPRCVLACPAHNRIPDFIAAIKDGDFRVGIDILRQTTNFPGICGRVCDKARQCEGACILGEEGGDPIAIGLLERFLAGWEMENGLRLQRAGERAPSSGRRVAIVGSGPSGLAAAEELAMLGHSVTVFEALPVIGGALAWGIPIFRLPQSVLAAEIDFLRALDVEFRLNTRIGPHLTVDQLLSDGFDAVFVGAGATVPLQLKIPGEDLDGVYSATEFLALSKLSQVNHSALWKPPVVGERLAVIGAGNTAMDVAQTAVRLGRTDLQELSASQTTMDVAETAMRLGFREVTVVYRRSEDEMPARREEIDSAREEGVHFRFLAAPLRFIGDESGRVRAMECVEMALGEPDHRGRRSPVPKRGTEFLVEVDTVVCALGYTIDRSLAHSTTGLATDQSGALTVDRQTGRTTKAGVWAGGDVISGPDTVVRAMVAGRRAAADIHRYLQPRPLDRNGKEALS
jgi:glutamate synthase (NADPH/NADH) small chain